MILGTIAQRHALLERSRSIAVVGASNNPLRPSYTVFSYLRLGGRYQVIPINPTLHEIDGIAAAASLTEYTKLYGPPDIVDLFRKPSEVLAIVDEAIAIGAKAIWFQYGVINETAITRADAAGLDVVVDKCIKVESARFDGGLATSGLNSGLITSRRKP